MDAPETTRSSPPPEEPPPAAVDESTPEDEPTPAAVELPEADEPTPEPVSYDFTPRYAHHAEGDTLIGQVAQFDIYLSGERTRELIVRFGDEPLDYEQQERVQLVDAGVGLWRQA
jgi:hypothetical protein